MYVRGDTSSRGANGALKPRRERVNVQILPHKKSVPTKILFIETSQSFTPETICVFYFQLTGRYLEFFAE